MKSIFQKIQLDAKRYGFEKLTFYNILYYFIIMPVPGLKFMTIFRFTEYFRRRNRPLFYFFYLWLRRYRYKYGFDISHRTQIGDGFYIGHFGAVVIHGDAVFGKNCNVSHGITIGQSNSGKSIGVPTLGDNVFVGPGACIFGSISIGNNVTIGANSVITENISSFSTVLSQKGIVIEKDMSMFYNYNRI